MKDVKDKKKVLINGQEKNTEEILRLREEKREEIKELQNEGKRILEI